MHVEHQTTGLTGATTRNALHKQSRIDLEEQHGIERLTDLCQHFLQALGLRDRAGKSVEDVATGGIALGKALTHHPEDGGVIDQLPSVHHRLGATPKIRAFTHVGTQQIPSRNLRDAVTFDQTLRLGTFAGTRRAEKNDTHDGRHSTRPVPTGQTVRYARDP